MMSHRCRTLPVNGKQGFIFSLFQILKLNFSSSTSSQRLVNRERKRLTRLRISSDFVTTTINTMIKTAHFTRRSIQHSTVHKNENRRVLITPSLSPTLKNIRITFFSGDAYCCGVDQFRTRTTKSLSSAEGINLVYQFISSAIANKPPPKKFIQAAHFFETKWYPSKNTEEKLIDFFERSPTHGSK